MTRKSETFVAQSETHEDVDVTLFTRIVQLFSGERNNVSKIEAIFGSQLHLSDHDQKPADESVLRPFDAGPADEEALDARFTPHDDKAKRKRRR